nr:TBCC domain-containing protein 1-like [Ipomoea batatas]
MQTLAPIKDKLLLLCADSAHRVNSQSISETLQISPGHTRLVLKTVATSYKRLLPKGHKDSAAVADVWPSTSAFDGFLSALSPLQFAFYSMWSLDIACLNLWTDQGSLLGIVALLGCPLHLAISKVN